MPTDVSPDDGSDSRCEGASLLALLRLYGVARALREQCSDAAIGDPETADSPPILAARTYRRIRTLAAGCLDGAVAVEFKYLFPATLSGSGPAAHAVRQIDLLLAWMFERTAQSAAAVLNGQPLVFPEEVLRRHSSAFRAGARPDDDDDTPGVHVLKMTPDLLQRLQAASASAAREAGGEHSDAEPGTPAATGLYL